MRPALIVRVTTPDGAIVTGEIQGCGGVVRHRQHIDRALRRLARGQTLDALYEPQPGHAAIYPHGHHTSHSPVDPTIVDLRGASIKVLP